MADASAPVSIPLPATEEQLGQVTFNDDGLVPAIIQAVSYTHLTLPPTPYV